MSLSRPLLVNLFLLLLFATPALAHEAQRPRDFETRLLTDQNDDCGGHGEGGCNGSDDLLALAVREAHFRDDGHMLVFALWLSPASSESARITISMEGPDGDETLDLTRDGDSLTMDEATRIEGPYPLLLDGEPDGDRVGYDIHVGRESLGLDVGDRLSRFRVEAFNGDTPGDVMPGTYVTEDGMAPKGETEIGAPAETVRPDYTLQGPTRMVGMTVPEEPVAFTAGEGGAFEVVVENPLGDLAQNMTLTETSPDGVVGRFERGSIWTERVGAGDERTVTMNVDAVEPGSHSLTLILTSDHGGLLEAQVDLLAEAAGGAEQANDAPGLTFAALVAAALMMATLVRPRAH